jgi:hypothetical protein
VHPKYKTPHVVTLITGLIVASAAAFFPVGQLADIANAGTLYAFLMVAIVVWQLRRREPNRKRAFRVPAVGLVAVLTIAGCVFLFANLPIEAILVLPIWTAVRCRDLLRLRLSPQPSRPRPGRGARAGDPRHPADHPRRGRGSRQRPERQSAAALRHGI